MPKLLVLVQAGRLLSAPLEVRLVHDGHHAVVRRGPGVVFEQSGLLGKSN